jgi:Ca2+-binding RTX toxin-like protein
VGKSISEKQWLTRAGVTLLMSTAAVAVGGPAFAASTGIASVSGATVTFEAGEQRVNQVTITRSGRTFTIDDRVAIKPGDGCETVEGDATTIRCTTATKPALLEIDLGDRADTFTNNIGIESVVYGGPGNDRLTGGAGDDLIQGGPGNDKLYGKAGNDRLDGDEGDDLEHGGVGDDTFSQDPVGGSDDDRFIGGPGFDFVTYELRTDPVALSINGVAGDDGTVGDLDGTPYQVEHDTIGLDIESLAGGIGADRIVGGPGSDVLRGGPSTDYLHGGDGDDSLYGEGTDVIWGDFLTNRDTLVGGAGNDRLDGGESSDKYHGDYDTLPSTDRPVGADTFVSESDFDTRDTVSYEFANGPVRVNVDSTHGEAGEGDVFLGVVTNVYGSPYDDVIHGPSTFLTGFIDGRAGDDHISGDHESLIYGGADSDHLTGGRSSYGSDWRGDDGAPDTLVDGNSCVVDPGDTAIGCASVYERN